jgi:hypothetical protein
MSNKMELTFTAIENKIKNTEEELLLKAAAALENDKNYSIPYANLGIVGTQPTSDTFLQILDDISTNNRRMETLKVFKEWYQDVYEGDLPESVDS